MKTANLKSNISESDLAKATNAIKKITESFKSLGKAFDGFLKSESGEKFGKAIKTLDDLSKSKK